MTKQIKRTTNKLVVNYTNGKYYTIPRVANFTVAEDGKSVTGTYTKVEKFHGITQEHTIEFNISLEDVVAMSYVGKVGEISKVFTVNSGRIDSVKEYSTDDDYYKPNKRK